MLNLNKRTKTKPKPKPTFIFKNCSSACAYLFAQLSYTTQHTSKVLIIFPLILQTIITAQMSAGGEGKSSSVRTNYYTNTI